MGPAESSTSFNGADAVAAAASVVSAAGTSSRKAITAATAPAAIIRSSSRSGPERRRAATAPRGSTRASDARISHATEIPRTAPLGGGDPARIVRTPLDQPPIISPRHKIAARCGPSGTLFRQHTRRGRGIYLVPAPSPCYLGTNLDRKRGSEEVQTGGLRMGLSIDTGRRLPAGKSRFPARLAFCQKVRPNPLLPGRRHTRKRRP